jgi:hypothetical protein
MQGRYELIKLKNKACQVYNPEIKIIDLRNKKVFFKDFLGYFVGDKMIPRRALVKAKDEIFQAVNSERETSGTIDFFHSEKVVLRHFLPIPLK